MEDNLEHHGIKGMRWGVRRERGPDGTVGGGRVRATSLSKTVSKHKEVNSARKTAGSAGVKKTIRGKYTAPEGTPRRYKHQYTESSDRSNKIRSAVGMYQKGSTTAVVLANGLASAITLSPLPLLVPTAAASGYGKAGRRKSEELARLSDKQLKSYVDRVNVGTKYARIPNPNPEAAKFVSVALGKRVNLGNVDPQARRLANQEVERRQTLKKKN